MDGILPDVRWRSFRLFLLFHGLMENPLMAGLSASRPAPLHSFRYQNISPAFAVVRRSGAAPPAATSAARGELRIAWRNRE